MMPVVAISVTLSVVEYVVLLVRKYGLVLAVLIVMMVVIFLVVVVVVNEPITVRRMFMVLIFC